MPSAYLGGCTVLTGMCLLVSLIACFRETSHVYALSLTPCLAQDEPESDWDSSPIGTQEHRNRSLLRVVDSVNV